MRPSYTPLPLDAPHPFKLYRYRERGHPQTSARCSLAALPAAMRSNSCRFSRRNIEELLHMRYRFVICLDAVDELKEKHRQRQLAVTNRLERWGSETIVLFSARTEMSTG